MRAVILIFILFQKSYAFVNDCDLYYAIFNNTYDVLEINSGEVLVKQKSLHQIESVKVSIGDVFRGVMDKHAKTSYKLTGIEVDQARFEVVSTFDTESFGGEVSTCKSEFLVKLNKNPN